MGAQHALAPEPDTHDGDPHEAASPDTGLRGALLRDAAPARLAVRGMCLSYAKRIVLDDISFEVGAGEVFGLLGPNGSGKTSLMRCLTGLVCPDRGTVWLDGTALGRRDRALRARLGVVFQEPSLDDRLSARENLLLGAALFGVGKKEAQQRATDLLVFMELEDRGRDHVRTLSGGMRRRLELARALIHRPSILLLDEPTTGLDPIAFERTWQRLLALRRLQGLTMLLSTHRADEAERCDRLLVFDRGHIVACDTPEGLLRRVAGDVIVLEADEPAALAQEIVERLDMVAHVHEGKVILERENGHTLVPRLVEAFAPGRLRSVSLRRPTLADAFFHLTGHGLDGGVSPGVGGQP